MATNQNIPSLENSHLAVVEKPKNLPSQEEIEQEKAKEAAKEKAEFDKLFAQLSSLSSKCSVKTHINTNEPCIQTSEQSLINTPLPSNELAISSLEKSQETSQETSQEIPKEIPLEISLEKSSNEFDEIYEQIIRIIAMKSKMVQSTIPVKQIVKPPVAKSFVTSPIVKPVVKQIVKPPVAKSFVTSPIVKPVVKQIVKSPVVKPPIVKSIPQCEACKKIFTTKGSLTRHQQGNMSCQKWLALSKEQQIPVIDKPIHMIVDDYLRKATTGDKPYQCRFCSMIFTNRGNHHKHYQTATSCNRMAYLEFKQLVTQ
jgi:hypothetical protein